MHIADGILSPAICLGTGVAAAAALGLSIRKLEETPSARAVPLAGMMASLIFAGQMVKFPLVVVPAYGHLLGGVLASVVVGPWAGCAAMALVLFLQVALFADGGWLAYGANLLNMGVVGSLGGYALYAAIRSHLPGTFGIVTGAVVAAWTSVIAGSALFCIEFGLSQPAGTFDIPRLFAMMTSFHSLVGVGEALVTAGIVSFVAAQRPDLIYTPQAAHGAFATAGRAVWLGAVVALAVAGFVAPFAADGADALEATAAEMKFDQLERPSRALVLDDYAVPLPGVDTSAGFWQKASVSLAGLFGTGCVFAISIGLGRARNKRRLSPELPHGG